MNGLFIEAAPDENFIFSKYFSFRWVTSGGWGGGGAFVFEEIFLYNYFFLIFNFDKCLVLNVVGSGQCVFSHTETQRLEPVVQIDVTVIFL